MSWELARTEAASSSQAGNLHPADTHGPAGTGLVPDLLLVWSPRNSRPLQLLHTELFARFEEIKALLKNVYCIISLSVSFINALVIFFYTV